MCVPLTCHSQTESQAVVEEVDLSPGLEEPPGQVQLGQADTAAQQQAGHYH